MLTLDRRIENFFLGYGYPIFTFALILFGYLTGLEVYTILINCVVTAFGILKTDHVKPLLFFMLTFMYQLNPWHMPMKPHNSDFYYTGTNLYVLIAAAVIIVVSIIVFIFKSHIFSYVSWESVPMIIPLVAFSLAMLFNGAFVKGDDFMDFVWGFGQVLVYLIIYLICYLGLRREKRFELLDYLQVLVLLMSWVLIIELIHRFGWAFAEGTIVSASGEINRNTASLGFGNCNIVGVHTAMLIPANLVGLISGRRPYASFATGTLIYLCALSTTSRNAMLFGSIFYVAFIVFALAKRIKERGLRFDINKKALGISTGVLAALAVVAIIFRDQVGVVVETVLAYYQKKGMDDSGRYYLWEMSFNYFLESPILGKGFYTLNLATPNSFEVLFDNFGIELVPDFAHNTVFELLGATGIVGFISYSAYRISSIVIGVKRASLERFLWFAAALYVAVASIVDNFVFQMFSPVLYTVIMAVIANVYDCETHRFSRPKHTAKFMKIYEAKLNELRSKEK